MTMHGEVSTSADSDDVDINELIERAPAWPVEGERQRYRDAAAQLASLGYSIDDIDHLDVDDVVMPLELFTRLVADLAGHRAAAFDAADLSPR